MQRHHAFLFLFSLLTFLALIMTLPSLAEVGKESNGNPRIVGGRPVDDPTKYPWMVGLISASATNLHNGHLCGGTLIASQWVVTAAHCLENETPNSVDVILGTVHLDNPSPGYERIRSSAFFIHPNYNSNTLNNDIALIRLKRASTWSFVDSWAASSDIIHVGTWTTAIGWGGTLPQRRTSSFPSQLQEVDLPIVSDQVCKESMLGITEKMFCAGFMEGGKDTCNGDSGGPLVKIDGRGHMLVGIVSFGEGCAQPNYYGVYTKVSEYNEWINSLIGQVQAYTVSATAGSGGTVSPTSQNVSHGSTTTFTVTPQTGYIHGTVGGTCPAGSFSGNTYNTWAITSNCSVSFSFTQTEGRSIVLPGVLMLLLDE